MILHVFTSDSDWLTAASEFIFSSLSEAREIRNAREAPQRSLHLCLAGGATPKPIYEALARDPRIAEISDVWRIHLWVGDEREAAGGSGFRNSEMIAAAFKHSPAAFVLHQWPPGRRALAARTYEEELSIFASERVRAYQPIFDLTILGMGEDGHTAGLFSPADMQRATVSPHSLVMLTEAPQEPKSRMTMAPEILRSSRRIIVLMQGLAKVRVLIANLVGEREDPIKHFLDETCEVIARI